MYNALLVVHTYCLYYTHIYLYKGHSLVQFQTHRNMHTILSHTFSLTLASLSLSIFSQHGIKVFFYPGPYWGIRNLR